LFGAFLHIDGLTAREFQPRETIPLVVGEEPGNNNFDGAGRIARRNSDRSQADAWGLERAGHFLRHNHCWFNLVFGKHQDVVAGWNWQVRVIHQSGGGCETRFNAKPG
jgi:hypothetical protein